MYSPNLKLNFHGRPDWRTRAVIDAGVELARREGTSQAAKFLTSQGIASSVIQRVLPVPRR